MSKPLNPRCTGFCTGDGAHPKGHRATAHADIDFMLAKLDTAGIKAEPSPAAVDALYRLGYGYHSVADALGISHERAYMILTGQSTGRGGD